jgi:hypothetical protein
MEDMESIKDIIKWIKERKKMVTYSACDNIVYSQRVNNSYKRQFCFSSYICGVLIMKTDERIKTLRDIIRLILIFLVFYLINGKKYFVYFSLFLLFICLFENKLIVFISKFLSKFSIFVYLAITIIALGIIFYFDVHIVAMTYF